MVEAGREPEDQTARAGWIEYPLIAVPSRELTRTLTNGERVMLNVPPHVMCLWKPALGALVTTALMATSLVRNTLPSGLLTLVWLASVALLVWSEFERRHRCFVATDQRILRVEGVVNRRVPVMRRGKVTDMELNRPLLGRIFNFGTIKIESAGQDQPLSRIDYVRFPVATFRRLNAVESKQVRFNPNPTKGGASRALLRARRAAAKVRGEVPLQTSLARETSARHIPAADFDHTADTGELPTVKRPATRPGTGAPGIRPKNRTSDNGKEWP